VYNKAIKQIRSEKEMNQFKDFPSDAPEPEFIDIKKFKIARRTQIQEKPKPKPETDTETEVPPSLKRTFEELLRNTSSKPKPDPSKKVTKRKTQTKKRRKLDLDIIKRKKGFGDFST